MNWFLIIGGLINVVLIVVNRFFCKVPDKVQIPLLVVGIVMLVVGIVKLGEY